MTKHCLSLYRPTCHRHWNPALTTIYLSAFLKPTSGEHFQDVLQPMDCRGFIQKKVGCCMMAFHLWQAHKATEEGVTPPAPRKFTAENQLSVQLWNVSSWLLQEQSPEIKAQPHAGMGSNYVHQRDSSILPAWISEKSPFVQTRLQFQGKLQQFWPHFAWDSTAVS